MTFRNKANKALTWSWLHAALGTLVQFGITAVIARLLLPADFGAVAVATVFVRFLAYFSQMGVGVAIVQKENVEKLELSGLLTLSVVIGAIFTGGAYLLAPIVGSLIETGDLTSILRVMSFSFLISGLAVVPLGLLRRELKYRELAIAELFGQAFGNGAVAIVLASLGCGVWSIVIGTLSQQVIVACLALYLVNKQTRISFAVPTSRCKAYINYGALHSWNTFLEYCYFNIEVLIIGKWLGAQSVGYYNRGFALSHLPVEQVIGSVARVLFPVLAKLRDDSERQRVSFLVAFFFGGIFATGFSGALFVSAKEVTSVLLGPTWKDAIPIVQILAIAVPVRYLLNLQSAWLDVEGVLKVRAVTILASLGLKVVLIPVAINYGLVGFLMIMILPDIVWQSFYLGVFRHYNSTVPRILIRAYRLFFLNALTVGLCVWAVTWCVNRLEWNSISTLAVQICVGLTLVAGAIVLLARRGAFGLRSDILSQIPMIGKLAALGTQRKAGRM